MPQVSDFTWMVFCMGMSVSLLLVMMVFNFNVYYTLAKVSLPNSLFSFSYVF